MKTLKEKIEYDLKIDKWFSIAFAFPVVFSISGFAISTSKVVYLVAVALASIYFLMWFNSYLLTKRDLQIYTELNALLNKSKRRNKK